MSDDHSSKPTQRQRQLDRILAELMHAIDAGEHVDATTWFTRHPHFRAELEEFFQQQQRFDRIVRPLRQAAAHVMHVRCPHCRSPIELVDEASLSNVAGPSCGSNFSLLSDETLSYAHGERETIGHFESL